MLVMSDVTDPSRVHTMTKGEGKAEVIENQGDAGLSIISITVRNQPVMKIRSGNHLRRTFLWRPLAQNSTEVSPGHIVNVEMLRA